MDFRALREDDLGRLSDWFCDREIARWWNQSGDSREVTAKYLPRILGKVPTQMWIVEIDSEAAGLLQNYLHSDYPDHDAAVSVPNAVGIDYLLGKAHRGRAFAPRMLRKFAALVLELHPEMDCCVATPAQANVASCRALERAGFVRLHECQPPDEPPAFVYSLTRGVIN